MIWVLLNLKLKNNTLEIKQGIFFNGQIFDAYIFVNDLIKSAKDEIILFDNYIDETVLTLLSKNPNINITLYTQNISKQLNLDIQKYNSQFINLTVVGTQRIWPARAFTLGHLTHNDLASVRIWKRAMKSLWCVYKFELSFRVFFNIMHLKKV